MKRYALVYSKEALKDLKKLDNSVSRVIYAWLKKNIDGCSDPRIHGKGLTANRSGQWRYRVGNYRIICKIEDDKVIVLVLTIGHRSTVYG
ncbi:MAG: type II toxin-antitoxin system RelE/ParE family toxin [Bacilli bacterium]|jgi:mRNA interferase RelE/StbE|nr:type II toxin-antitoxin system RelE/ParE family toxin [Bacilli bacterium]